MSSSFFPRLISAVADWMSTCLPYFHTWCGLSANLGCGSETCYKRLAKNTGRKNSPSSASSRNFVGIYLRNSGTYRQSVKNLFNSNISSTCPYNMVDFGSLAAEICWRVWGTPANFNGFHVLAAFTARHSSSGCQPNFVALNRGRHLYSAGRP